MALSIDWNHETQEKSKKFLIFFSSVTAHSTVEFPSISFCKIFTFKSRNILEYTETLDNISADSIQQWITQNTLPKDDLFHFVQHRSEKRKFPCDTMYSSSSDYVGPCAFPFKMFFCEQEDPINGNCSSFKEAVSSYNCSLFDSDKPWCATRVYKNRTAVDAAYAICEPECHGEIPSKHQPEHIASPAFENLWRSRFFHLNQWEAGHCHTYSPNETFSVRAHGQFYALIGDGLIKKKTNEFGGYQIYLHSAKVVQTF